MDTKDINLRLVFDMLDDDTQIPDELKEENEKAKERVKKAKEGKGRKCSSCLRIRKP